MLQLTNISTGTLPACFCSPPQCSRQAWIRRGPTASSCNQSSRVQTTRILGDISQYGRLRNSRVTCAVDPRAMESLNNIVMDMRKDPVLSKVLDKPRIQRALKEIQADPGALSRYANDPEVMSVVTRLVNRGTSQSELKKFRDLSTSPGDVAVSLFRDKQLAAKLQQPRIRAALSELRANPAAAMNKYANDEEVTQVLAMLEQRLAPQASSSTVDVEASAANSSSSKGGSRAGGEKK